MPLISSLEIEILSLQGFPGLRGMVIKMTKNLFPEVISSFEYEKDWLVLIIGTNERAFSIFIIKMIDNLM